MKKITISGITLGYETFWDLDPFNQEYAWTEFYLGTEEKKIRKGFLGIFGPVEFVNIPKLVFSIDADTENPRLSKKWWRERIELEMELLNRRKEIEEGQLI